MHARWTDLDEMVAGVVAGYDAGVAERTARADGAEQVAPAAARFASGCSEQASKNSASSSHAGGTRSASARAISLRLTIILRTVFLLSGRSQGTTQER
jgi:hypothetical protein